MSVVFLVYAIVSLALGGVAATIAIWEPPTLLKRADGSGKFMSPPYGTTEVVLFGLFVAVLWPLLIGAAIVDALRRRG